MENCERPSGKIESTKTIWDMTDVEKRYSAKAGGELEANREKLFDALFESFPDCQTKLDIAEQIIERFNWFEYQSKQEMKMHGQILPKKWPSKDHRI